MIVAELFAKLGLMVDKSSWSHGDQILNDMKSKVTGIAAGFLAFSAGSGLLGMIHDVIEMGGHLNDLSQSTGVSTDSLQEWTYVAGLAGADADQVTIAIGKLNRGLGEAARTGKGPVVDAFGAIGLSMSDAAVKSGNIDEVLLNVANKFADMKDGPKKVAAAVDLFGKSGAKLIPTLNQGADGIAKLKEEAHALGGVISNKDIKELDDIGDDIDRIKFAAKGLRNEAVVALIPVLKELVTGLLDWVKANRELIKETLKQVIEGFIDVLKSLAEAVMFIAENWEYVRVILIGLGVIVAAVIAKIIIGWAAAAIALAPLLIALGIVATVIHDLWMGVTEGKGVIASVVRWAIEKFNSLVTRIKSTASSIGDFFRGIGTSIYDFFSNIWSRITGFFDNVVDTAKRGANEVIDVLNKIPGVNINKFDTKGSPSTSSGGEPTASNDTPTRPDGSSGVNQTFAMGDINVTSQTGDPVAIGAEVRRQVKQELTNTFRDAMSDVGGERAA